MMVLPDSCVGLADHSVELADDRLKQSGNDRPHDADLDYRINCKRCIHELLGVDNYTVDMVLDRRQRGLGTGMVPSNSRANLDSLRWTRAFTARDGKLHTKKTEGENGQLGYSKDNDVVEGPCCRHFVRGKHRHGENKSCKFIQVPVAFECGKETHGSNAQQKVGNELQVANDLLHDGS
jgi:hypothetical protein